MFPTRNPNHVKETLEKLTSAYQRPRGAKLVSGVAALQLMAWVTSGSGTVANSAPTVSAIDPPIGPLGGGTAVTITGANFTGATLVQIGDSVHGYRSCTSLVVVDPNTITCVTPNFSSIGAGAYDVVVTTPGGSGTLSGGFRYIAGWALWLRSDWGITPFSLAVPSSLASWSADTGSSWSHSQPDPDGGTSASKLVEDTGNTAHTAYSYPTTTDDATGTRTVEISAKAAGRSWLHLTLGGATFPAWINLSTGAVGTVTNAAGDTPTVTVTDRGGGWWRITVVQTGVSPVAWFGSYVRIYLATGDNASDTYVGDGTSGILFYQPSLTTTGMSAWADQSGVGDANRDVAQSAATQKPAYLASDAGYNGRPSVVFDGSNDTLVSGVWASPLSRPSTWIVVGHSAFTAAVHIAIDGVAVGHRNYLDRYSSTEISMYAGTQVPTSFNWGSKAAVLAEFGTGGGGLFGTLYGNDFTTPLFANNNVGSGDLTQLSVNSQQGAGSFAWNGPMVEIIAFSGTLSAAEKNAIRDYLNSRYGMSI